MADHIIVNVGEKLIVGQVDTSFLTAASKLTPGTAVLNGPVYIGATPQIGIARATCMIGPPIGISVPASLEVTGVSNIFGSLNIAAVSTFTGVSTKLAATFKKALSLKFGIGASLGLSTKSSLQITNGVKTCSAGIVTPRIDVGICNAGIVNANYGAFKQVAAPFKLFDIPHPNKKGMRLKHSCLEGPEIGVYYRGKLKGTSTIQLPDYWKNLVDLETITVQLTPHNYYQELFYKTVEWGKIIKVVNNSGAEIDCSYIVYAERIDVEKLLVEVEEKEEHYPEKN